VTATALHGDAFYLGAGERGVFAVHHPPATAPSPVAVLLCAPFGNAELCAHRSLREWAGTLARAGHHALRFDLPGTGDSAGDAYTPDLLARWTEAIAAAARWLRTEAGVERVVAAGVGLGGLLAANAAADDGPIDDLALWGTPRSGRLLVRELRAFARLEASAGDDAAGTEEEGASDGEPALLSGGFAMSAATVEALSGLDLTALDHSPAAGGMRRALLLARDGVGSEDWLAEHLLAHGWEVQRHPGAGYGAMMAEPYESRPPRETFAAVGAWLAQAPSEGGRRADPQVAPERTPELDLDAGGVPIRERPLAVRVGADMLPGVLAEPRAPAGGAECVVFLNAGALRRVGPNRMWVEAARRFAARGVPTLRIDLAGIGDADGDDEGWSDDASFYVPGFVGQARAVLTELEARGFGPRFVLGGLCSGAYWSFHAALEDERVQAALMLNTRALFWDGQRRLEQEAAHSRKLAEPRLWLKVVRGGITRARMLEYARAIAALAARIPARVLARLRARAGGGDRLDHALDTLESRGQRLWMMFGPREQLRLELERDGRIAAIGARPAVVVDLIDGDREVHTLEPLRLQRAAHGLLDLALERELAHVREPRGAGVSPAAAHS
jgi:alpha-beta hydrolase superfamily lysophospholipase